MKSKRWLSLAALGALMAGGAGGAAQAGPTWNGLKAGNPVIPGYFADPCCRKFGDTYYIYATPDGWDVGKGPAGAWTSKDFVNWEWHPMNWPSTEFKWAPSVVQRDGKFYMITSVPCMLWCGVADAPLGPWKNIMGEDKPMLPDQTPKETIVLDGEVFIDTDGQAYIWYGTWWRPTGAKLNKDMRSFDGAPIQYFKNPNNPDPPKGLVQGCMEAPYMFKRNGTYYLMYSDAFCQDSTYNVKYCTSNSPMGPFTYDPKKNPILETNDDDTVDGPGHHTILEDNGKVYIVYHRHDNPHDKDGAHRQTAIDELHFNADGSIEKVEPGHGGVGYLAPSTKRDTNLALGKPATASSSQSPDFAPAYAVDQNNGTLWKADSFTFPQWLQVDLGRDCAVKRVETTFQYPQVPYRYQIEYSSDGQNWKTYADQRQNKAGGIKVDKADVTGRYFRITVLGHDTGRRDQVAAIWSFGVYDGIDKHNQAPVVNPGPALTATSRFPTLQLDGIVDDDGQPNGPVKTAWTKASGPGEVTFEHADRCRTKATFSAPGEYVLQLQADDGAIKGSATLNCKIVPPGDKIVSYNFDEGSGAIVQDDSNNNRYGVMRKHAARGLGVHGKAINFDGQDDLITVPALGTAKNLTVATWVNVHTLGGPSNIVCGDASAEGAVQLAVEPDGRLRFALAGRPPVTSEPLLAGQLGDWRHIAAVYDSGAGAVSFYVDGKASGSKPLSGAGAGAAIDLNGGLRIGGAGAGARGLDGEIDDFAMYDKVMAADEIAALARPVAASGLGDIHKLADGSTVTVLGKTVAFAPHDAVSGERTSKFFYIAEKDGSGGIRVQDGAMGQDQVAEDNCVSFTAIIKTAPSGERYLEMTSPAGAGAPREAAPIEKSIGEPVQPGSLVKVTGKVTRIQPDGAIVLGNGAAELWAVPGKGLLLRKTAVGHTIALTGVVSADKPLLIKSLTPIDPPPPPGLAFYSFDGEGDVARDSSGSGNDAKLVNNPAHVAGKAGGGALRLQEGKHSYIQPPDLGAQMALTVAAWVNLNSLGRDEFSTSILHCNGWADGDLHFMIQKGNGQIRAAVGGCAEMDSRFSFKDRMNQWVHVAFVYDARGRKMQLYINGKLDGGRDLPNVRPINLSHACIGAWGGGSRFLDGSMDEVRIYDRALNADEVAKLAGGAQ